VSQTEREHRPLRLGEPEIHPVTTSDNVQLKLTRYRAGPKGPIILAPGYGTSTKALATDTVDSTFPEYLYERDYDVWLFDYRSSPELPSAGSQYTVDDIATHDWPAAVAKVIEVSGSDTVQVTAHCVGSLSFIMSEAAGLKGVRSGICSQVALHPVVVKSVQAKALLRLATMLRVMLGTKTMTTEFRTASVVDRALDGAMKLFPTIEKCDQEVCRRILFLYGEVYRHDQLNEVTHRNVHEMFGVANMTVFEHMSRIVAHGRAVDAQGEDTYIANAGNIDTPITFIHGDRNNFFLPEGTQQTYELLRRLHGPDKYRRTLIPGYAHMDCFIGKNAARDVFPMLHEDLERFN
jgi:cholesterol oxidase